MNTSNENRRDEGRMDRREFLRSGVRYGLLAGMAVVAGAVCRRGPEGCNNGSLCPGCPVLPTCELPQAQILREAKAPSLVPSSPAYREIFRIPGTGTPARDLVFNTSEAHGLNSATGTTASPGELFIATGNTVLVFNARGERLREIPCGSDPVRCLASTSDGTLYIASRNRVMIITSPNGAMTAFEHERLTSKRTWITSLAVSGNDLFIADAGNRVVLRFDLSQKRFLNLIGEKSDTSPGFIVPSPYFSIGLHPDGLLRVTNPGRHRVEAYTFDGDFAGSWGRAGGTPEAFCGCCNPSRITPLPDGRLLTCEKGLPRIKIFSATGDFETLLAGEAEFPENAAVGAGRRDTDASLAGLSTAVDPHTGRIAILDHVTGITRVLEAVS